MSSEIIIKREYEPKFDINSSDDKLALWALDIEHEYMNAQVKCFRRMRVIEIDYVHRSWVIDEIERYNGSIEQMTDDTCYLGLNEDMNLDESSSLMKILGENIKLRCKRGRTGLMIKFNFMRYRMVKVCNRDFEIKLDLLNQSSPMTLLDKHIVMSKDMLTEVVFLIGILFNGKCYSEIFSIILSSYRYRIHSVVKGKDVRGYLSACAYTCNPISSLTCTHRCICITSGNSTYIMRSMGGYSDTIFGYRRVDSKFDIFRSEMVRIGDLVDITKELISFKRNRMLAASASGRDDDLHAVNYTVVDYENRMYHVVSNSVRLIKADLLVMPVAHLRNRLSATDSVHYTCMLHHSQSQMCFNDRNHLNMIGIGIAPGFYTQSCLPSFVSIPGHKTDNIKDQPCKMIIPFCDFWADTKSLDSEYERLDIDINYNLLSELLEYDMIKHL